MSQYSLLTDSEVGALRERIATFTLQYKQRDAWIDGAKCLGVDSNGRIWLEVPDPSAGWGFSVLCAGRDELRKKPALTENLVGLVQRAQPYNNYDPIQTVHVFRSRENAAEYLRVNYGGSHPDLGDVIDMPPVPLVESR